MSIRNVMLFYLIGFVCAESVWATPMTKQDLGVVRDSALQFATLEAKAISGEVSIKAESLDARLALPACTQALEAFLPAGSLLRGAVMIGVRCNDRNGWSVFVPITVKVTTLFLVSKHPLPQGKIVGESDVLLQKGEVNHPGTLTDIRQAEGKILKYALGGGQVLKQEMLRAPYVITQGQKVLLEVAGNGFNIRAEGVALNNASETQMVQVKTSSGQVVSGLARADGIVEIKK